MLHGVGVDLTLVPRVARLAAKYPGRFLGRAFHPREIAQHSALPAAGAAQFLAGRWAAKEAALKALGRRVLFPELLVLAGTPADPRPRLDAVGSARRAFLDAGVRLPAHLSISHDGDYAAAFVVLERGPSGPEPHAEPSSPAPLSR